MKIRDWKTVSKIALFDFTIQSSVCFGQGGATEKFQFCCWLFKETSSRRALFSSHSKDRAN